MSSIRARRGLSGARWALAIASLMAAVACGGTPGEEAEAAPAAAAEQQRSVLAPEDVAVATRSDLAAGVVLTGSLQPYKMVRVKSQVSGTVRGVRVDRGTPVRRGQVMATIEAAGVRTQAEAARANLALAKQKLEAARTLHEAGAMSQIDFRTAQAAYEAAQAQAAQAEEAEARSTIRAPITGVVSERSVDGGEAVGMDAPLFTVVNSDTLELSGQIPVDRAAHVRVGAPVAFTLTAAPDRELRGRVARIDPVADPGTRQVGVYVQLGNAKHEIIGALLQAARALAAREGRERGRDPRAGSARPGRFDLRVDGFQRARGEAGGDGRPERQGDRTGGDREGARGRREGDRDAVGATAPGDAGGAGLRRGGSAARDGTRSEWRELRWNA